MKLLLWINTIVEGLAGLLFLFFPGITKWIRGMEGLADNPAAVMLLNMYGVAALTLGVFSALLLFRLKYYQEVLIDGLSLFALFHTGIAATQFWFNADPRPGVLHGILAASFIYYWLKQK